MFEHIYILGTILFTVYGQLILKWRITNYGPLPDSITQKIIFLYHLLLDPYILSGLFSALLAAFFWMAAMTKFELSYAYPFMSLAFVCVLVLSAILLHESLTIHKMIGLLFIVVGIIITGKGL